MTMSDQQTIPYRVLARKYRPQNFDELIGQQALVKTLKNAIDTGRIAHAFMLTGVRGVGKTTTARIIAKTLNYTGSDGKAGPTTGDTSDCALSQAITEDRHPDVIEMDAASRTGVDDIREILDGVRYAPTEARYKVYIIDEVHMLSKQAFNALLKTLEEPPEHVKFIFATTEIRKVPITVLSRCQRFDLKRVSVEELTTHFANICKKEGVEPDNEALALIARAADGSVRDGLSLLDQAIALSSDKLTGQHVQDMLGLADRAKNLDILEHTLSGNTKEALEICDDLYKAGADPAVLIQDLLDLTHILTRIRAVPTSQNTIQALSSDQMERASEMASKLSMPSLSKAWQILLKGLQEVNIASNPQSAAEMVVIRLCYAANLPDPSDLLKKLKSMGNETISAGQQSQQTPTSSEPPNTVVALHQSMAQNQAVAISITPQVEEQDDNKPDIKNIPITNLQSVVTVLEDAGEMILAGQVFQYLHFVKIDDKGDNKILEIRPTPLASPALPQNLGNVLSRITDNRWVVSVSGQAGESTLAETQEQAKIQELEEIKADPLIAEIFSLFPDADITDIKR